jgi:hypothetical protein
MLSQLLCEYILTITNACFFFPLVVLFGACVRGRFWTGRYTHLHPPQEQLVACAERRGLQARQTPYLACGGKEGNDVEGRCDGPSAMWRASRHPATIGGVCQQRLYCICALLPCGEVLKFVLVRRAALSFRLRARRGSFTVRLGSIYAPHTTALRTLHALRSSGSSWVCRSDFAWAWHLCPIVTNPHHPLALRADGRLVWRWPCVFTLDGLWVWTWTLLFAAGVTYACPYWPY